MSDDNKIKKFPSKKNNHSKSMKSASVARLKHYLGFEYVKLEKDVNQISFNKAQLAGYPNSIKYTISVSRTIDEKTYLYEYFVEGKKITDFFRHYIDGKIEGEIIQIEKFSPDNLA